MTEENYFQSILRDLSWLRDIDIFGKVDREHYELGAEQGRLCGAYKARNKLKNDSNICCDVSDELLDRINKIKTASYSKSNPIDLINGIQFLRGYIFTVINSYCSVKSEPVISEIESIKDSLYSQLSLSGIPDRALLGIKDDCFGEGFHELKLTIEYINRAEASCFPLDEPDWHVYICLDELLRLFSIQKNFE